jgi:hypothetical protein
MDTQQPAASVLPPALADLTEQVWAEARKAVRHGSAGGNSTQGFWDNLQGFLHAVDWQVRWGGCRHARMHACAFRRPAASWRRSHTVHASVLCCWVAAPLTLPRCITQHQERWLQGILAAHVCLFGLVLACRRNTAVLSGVFLLLGVCVCVRAAAVLGWQVAGAARVVMPRALAAPPLRACHQLIRKRRDHGAPPCRRMRVLWRARQRTGSTALAGLCHAGLF